MSPTFWVKSKDKVLIFLYLFIRFSWKFANEIEVKNQSKQIALLQSSISSQEREIPEYLEVDQKEFKGRFLRAPLINDVPYPVVMEPNLVVEYYSRS